MLRSGAAWPCCQGIVNHNLHEKRIVNELVEALTLLIPTANLLLPVQRTVSSALEIANATSLEHALYQFYLAERWAPSDDDTIALPTRSPRRLYLAN